MADHLANVKRKIVLIGDGAVGKSSLLERFILDMFSDDYLMTLGVKILKKQMEIESVKLTLIIWDVMGQTSYTSVQADALTDAKGALIVCDVTRLETLDSFMDTWLPRLLKTAGAIPMVFLGNKADLADQASFGLKEIFKRTEGLEAPCMLTSAKTGMNVEQAFFTLGMMLIPDRLRANNPLEVVNPEEVRTPADAARLISRDFCIKHGEEAIARQILKERYMEAGMDPKYPHPAGITKVIFLLEKVDRDIQGHESAERNRSSRLRVLGWLTERSPPKAELLRGPRDRGAYPRARRA